MLYNIIDTIFRSNGYNEVAHEFENKQYATTLFEAPLALGRQEYFVIVEKKQEAPDALVDILLHHSDDLFEKLIESGNVNEHFEKNSTLIICYRADHPASELILAIEEDPYNFKKNVITYTKHELAELSRVLAEFSKADHFCNDLFNSLVNAGNGEAFRKFKESMGTSQNHYSLLLKISAKISFLSYQAQGNSLYNLDQDINSQLNKKEALIYDAITTSRDFENDESFADLIARMHLL